MVVGFLAEDAEIFELFAIGPRLAVQFNADQQSAPANFLDRRVAQLRKFGEQPIPQLGRTHDQLLLLDDPKRLECHRAPERVASIRRTMAAGI